MSLSFEEGYKISDLKVVQCFECTCIQLFNPNHGQVHTHTQYERVLLSLNFTLVAGIALK